jgi:hypothetical protein
MVACGLAALQEWQQSASGPTAPIHPVIVTASAATKKIFRSIARPTTEPEEVMRGICITGQTANWAAFFPERLYSSDMSVDELLWLAASSVRIAHEFDSLGVDRLDLAICRHSMDGFELIHGDPYWDEADIFSRRIDASIRRALRRPKASKEY